MQSERFSIGLTAAVAVLAMTVFLGNARAATEKQLHNFKTDGKDGNNPNAGLIFDRAGNLYGTTYDGGAHGGGTVFELTPKKGGGWRETILHNFNPHIKDGSYPLAGVIFDASGNLYGTTSVGGLYQQGTVFELTAKAGGGWTETILHSFSNGGRDGAGPAASLIFDAAGNLYGTTQEGGDSSCGAVFELKPHAGGGWGEEILHRFSLDGKDGCTPLAHLIFDEAGNLYGTTKAGGFFRAGTVFELMPKAGGAWTEKRLEFFNSSGRYGYNPVASLIFDAVGNLYGTTETGGHAKYKGGHGTVFSLTPAVHGVWAENVLHWFNENNGGAPVADLIFDSLGNLYGTTSQGGDHLAGTVFKLAPQTGGGWTGKILHEFNNNGKDGSNPSAGLILDSDGNLYGTTADGGAFGAGTVFEITP
jgi:uncharacterized repeat protein (TIGR03803 family)